MLFFRFYSISDCLSTCVPCSCWPFLLRHCEKILWTAFWILPRLIVGFIHQPTQCSPVAVVELLLQLWLSSQILFCSQNRIRTKSQPLLWRHNGQWLYSNVTNPSGQTVSGHGFWWRAKCFFHSIWFLWIIYKYCLFLLIWLSNSLKEDTTGTHMWTDLCRRDFGTKNIIKG